MAIDTSDPIENIQVRVTLRSGEVRTFGKVLDQPADATGVDIAFAPDGGLRSALGRLDVRIGLDAVGAEVEWPEKRETPPV